MQPAPDMIPAGSDYIKGHTDCSGGRCAERTSLGLSSPYLSSAFHHTPVPLSDPIDIVNDYIAPHEYLAEEDPKLYQSIKTRRGPLSEDWIDEINQNLGQSAVMCAYKLCKVEFRYWGMQSKIERFIHDVGTYRRPAC